ncbi:Hsp20/alpha crystallin family protein [Paenibacillus sp. P96]|uniref:Hsp20/alpha crystallin family protein n=1 Tax=Paenibacillus zeirhizosphaerae TaxID=2987519 RepID=A0ABT9FUG5_9BACL|nr:Hsp20/alpha crystallin family protein [Paenibacillus sp. P96]MDP4098353.1 Hsp20/alpha crystallin family protein [Paenibacillus sp. P96]
MFDLVPFRKRSEELFDQMVKSFNTVMDDSLFPSFSKGVTQPFRIDIREIDDKYVVEAELPGVAREDIDIDLNQNYLTIRARRNELAEQIDDNNKIIRRERRSGEFVRRFYVENIEEDAIRAKLQDGILTLEVPKRVSTSTQHKRINIE